MIRTFLLAVLIVFGWSSIEFRSFMANVLRSTANFIDSKESVNKNPKHFKVPNPFYMKNKEDLGFLINYFEDEKYQMDSLCLNKVKGSSRSHSHYILRG